MADHSLTSLSKQSTPSVERTVEHLVVDDQEELKVLQTLSNETALKIFTELQHDSKPPATLADEFDLSLQTVHYHLGNLESLGLIRPVDTWYSEKGVEMTVYAASCDPLVLSIGSNGRLERLKTSLASMASAFGLVLFVGLIVEVMAATQTAEEPDPQDIGVGGVGSTGDTHWISELVLGAPGLTMILIGTLVLVGVALLRTWWH